MVHRRKLKYEASLHLPCRDLFVLSGSALLETPAESPIWIDDTQRWPEGQATNSEKRWKTLPFFAIIHLFLQLRPFNRRQKKNMIHCFFENESRICKPVAARLHAQKGR